MAIDGSELDFTNCGKLPKDNDVDGPGLNSKSDSGLDAYDKRFEVIGNRKSSDKDSTGFKGVLQVCGFHLEVVSEIQFFLPGKEFFKDVGKG